MHLASLTLHGFKSFAERVTLELSSGVTGIVGPNGSGKSNLLDALRWASGGGRASEFRAGDKTELIFHGSAGARSLGYAEVELGLEPTTGRSLHISRTLLRDGQSQLKLNGKNARFLDVEEALSGSGLGKSSPAIIGQGEVGQVLVADPERLLGYLEEATGIARLSHRREAALSRLETARAHLERLEDLLLELRGRCERLHSEAEEAEKATTLQAESLRLRYTLARRRAESLEREIRGLREQAGELQGALEGGRRELESAQQRCHEARHTLSEREQTYRQALAESEGRRGDLRVAEERLRAARQRREALSQERSRLHQEAQGLEPNPPQAPEGDAETLAQAEEAARGTLETQRRALTTAEAEVDELTRRLEAARRAEAAHAQATAAFESRQQQLTGQLADVEARLETLPEGVESPDEAGLEQLQNELQSVRRALEHSREKLEVLQREHAGAEAEAQAQERTASRSRASLEARQGYAQGPKRALTSGITGVIGSVADLLRVPEAYRAAIGSALGRRAENVVVESAEVAQRVLAHVKRSGGWVTLVPLDLLVARKTSLSLEMASEPGVLGLASELVETESRFEVLLAQLLGSTLLLESLEQAVVLARRYPRRPRLVTLEGDVLEPYGALTGGSRRVQSSILGLAAEADEAEGSAHEARERAETLLASLSESQAQYLDQRELTARLEAQLREVQDTLQQARQRAAVQSSRQQELEERREELQAHLTRLHEPAERSSTDLEPLTVQMQQAQAELGEQRDRLAASAQQLAEMRQQRAVFEERQQRYQQALEHFQEEHQRAELRRRRLEANGSELEQAEAQLSLRERELKEAEAALPRGLEAVQASFMEAQGTAGNAEQALTRLSQQQAERGAGLEELKLTLARRETASEAAQEEVETFPDGLEPVEGSLRSLRERLNETQNLLAAIGPVNHRAQQEYKAQRERLETLTAQGSEASLAISELQGVLHDLDREQAARLNVALERLRRNFAEHVQQLFGPGSQADVEIERAAGRPAGLRLSLQPAGKRTRSLKLLSVGERSMGALAFLFALLQNESEAGLPIAILDEVDAPLDEANIRRFRDFVKVRAERGTQFILITHQKTTMEVADALWGVTSERGASRVFSIRRPQEAALS